jgi:enamine deaminase RidA (YjgF/YER057c/UK114 family)
MPASSVESRLADLGLQLPEAPHPVGSYRATVIANGLLFVSGQLPLSNGVLKHRGRVGIELTDAAGGEAAQLAALNVLAQIRLALNGFDRLISLVRVEGYIASAPGWTHQPRVLDYASNLFAAVLGERGVHTRSAIATPQLPMDAPVELVVTAAVGGQ